MLIRDFFDRVTMEAPDEPIKCDRCLFTMVSWDYQVMLDDMMQSVAQLGNIPDAQLVIFALNPSTKLLENLRKYNAIIVNCYTKNKYINADSKSVVYYITYIVDAQKYLFLDADTFVVDDLNELYDIINTIPQENLGLCSEYVISDNIIGVYGTRPYNGNIQSLYFLLEDKVNDILDCSFFINTGMIIGTKIAFEQLLATIQSLPNVREWNQVNNGSFHEQMLINIALALNNKVNIIPQRYNLLTIEKPDIIIGDKIRSAEVDIKIIHFTGTAKNYQNYREILRKKYFKNSV